ncbi:hypothetical protein MHEC_28290 [Mycobacterium heckeshornense]|uniref:Uncharacterized protein n=1 Tax=Mycobacterium heckeshornense TaxID=110505 RepID=A0A7R7JHZ8_9MYCO|nr:hypothetical protein MHEC_28290 [Mycobacterium heckeshornense]
MLWTVSMTVVRVGCAGGLAWSDRYPIAMWLGWGLAVLAENDGELAA